MNTAVWSVIGVALAVYAGFTVFFYIVKLRPLLRAAGLQAGSGHSAVPAERQMQPSAVVVEDSLRGDGRPVAEANCPGADLLQLTLEEWRYTFDAIWDPVLILDCELTVVQANRAARHLLSTNGAPLAGKRCHQLFSSKDEACPICPIQQVIAENRPYKQDVTHRYLGRTFSVSCAPIKRNGEIIGFVHSAKDISHQRNLERRLVHAHKLEAIATLAGGIGHDFNNILGAILGNADLLLYRMPVGEKQGSPPSGPPISFEEIFEHVLAIKKAGTRARDLVAQILAFSRQSTNQRRNVFIGPVVRDAFRLLRASIPSTIELKLAVAEDLGMIYADPSQIQQVLMNLCSNAVQAMESKGGTIEIALREIETGTAEQLRYHNLDPGKYIVLSVKDTGKGMPAEMIERIFDPFFTTRDVGEGSGMGLAVLHGIVVSHDGIIDVQSEVEKGTVFTLFFPKITEEGLELDDQMSTMPKGYGTILFVDDEEDIVKMRTRMLSCLGYRVLPATGPEQALSYFTRNQERIDLVITDHTMPRMTGLQLATEISSIRSDLPIFLCSGYSEAVTPEEAERAGIRRFLAKPVDMRMLADAIQEFLPQQKRKEE